MRTTEVLIARRLTAVGTVVCATVVGVLASPPAHAMTCHDVNWNKVECNKVFN